MWCCWRVWAGGGMDYRFFHRAPAMKLKSLILLIVHRRFTCQPDDGLKHDGNACFHDGSERRKRRSCRPTSSSRRRRRPSTGIEATSALGWGHASWWGTEEGACSRSVVASTLRKFSHQTALLPTQAKQKQQRRSSTEGAKAHGTSKAIETKWSKGGRKNPAANMRQFKRHGGRR